MRALVVSVSNRASAGVYEDRTGPVLVEGLAVLGFEVDGPRVVPDGDPVEAVLREAVASSYDVVLTSGGTGITPTDRTPEMTRRVLDTDLPGVAEAVRAHGVAKGVPTAALSRPGSAPVSRPCTTSPGASRAVNMRMGVRFRRARSWRVISNPLTSRIWPYAVRMNSCMALRAWPASRLACEKSLTVAMFE